MDIVTQALLGSVTFSCVMDRHIGRKSLLIGAVAGIVPDLDAVFAPFFNEIEFLSIHRSISHSIFFALLLAVLLGLAGRRYLKGNVSLKTWSFAFFLAIVTHPVLDWFTTYGTKLFSPANGHIFSINSIHVFEPIFTGILLVGVVMLLVRRRNLKFRWHTGVITLGFALFYLGWTMVSKVHAYYHFRAEIEAQGIDAEKVLISPTPLNSILWHGIIRTSEGYYFGTYSPFDSRDGIKLSFIKSEFQYIPDIQEERLGSMYLEYTQNFPLIVDEGNGHLKVYAVKYGPINYFGDPEFAYPMCIDIRDQKAEDAYIEYDKTQRGPVKNYRNLLRRIKGV